MNRLSGLCCFLVLGALTGCPSSAPTGGTDGGVAQGDAGPTCSGLATQLGSLCASDQAVRQCGAEKYGAMCATENTAALQAALQCLSASSSTSAGCRTLSDPSGAADCVKTALTPFVTTQARDLATRIETLCPAAAADTSLFSTILPLPLMSTATLTSYKTCIDSATSCDSVLSCFNALPPVASLLSCD
jgi:hypothetical protein